MRCLRYPIRLLAAVAALLTWDASAEDQKKQIFIWQPERSPSGPILIIVNIDDQVAFVYRNGVQIGQTPVSTGRPGYPTPTGVFSILGKDATHRSKKYNNAAMPFAERLTWSGIFLHAGDLPFRNRKVNSGLSFIAWMRAPPVGLRKGSLRDHPSLRHNCRHHKIDEPSHRSRSNRATAPDRRSRRLIHTSTEQCSLGTQQEQRWERRDSHQRTRQTRRDSPRWGSNRLRSTLQTRTPHCRTLFT